MDCNDQSILTKGSTMSIGIFRGEHSFTAIINQTDKVITPLNPFDRQASALLTTPGLKPVIFTTHQAYLDTIVKQPGVFTLPPFMWKIGVKYKYFGLRTTVTIQPYQSES